MESPVPSADRENDRSGGGISLETLIIASLASAAASFAASRIWGSGTLISAAATPVVVALVSEFLHHARPRRRVEPPAAVRPDVGRGAIVYYGTAGRWRPRWRPVLVTGLLAFAIVVALYTVPDLLAGRSITGNGQPTTFFGDSAHVTKTTSPKATVTTTIPTTTITKTAPTATKTAPTATKTAPTATKTAPTATKTAPTATKTAPSTTTAATSTPNTTAPTTSTTPPTVTKPAAP